jgi:replicative DNA helicase
MMPPRIDALRQAPHSIDMEAVVLGALMLEDGKRLVEIADWITEEDFYAKDHRLLFRAISELASANKPCDVVTMAEWFETNGLSDIVPSKYILSIANNATAANVVSYAEIVKEKSRLRQLIDIGTEITGQAFAPRADASLIASQATTAVTALVSDPRAGGLARIQTAVTAWFSDLHERYEEKQELTGLDTGLAALNDITFGWQPELIFIAGRPNAGKTVLGVQQAVQNSVNNKKPTAIFSLEMSKKQLVGRMVANIGHISHRSLRHPMDIHEDEWPLITETMLRISNSPLHIDDQSNLAADQIIARATRQHLRSPLSMIVIDHFHEMKFRKSGQDRIIEMGDEARKLKKLAKDLNIPVLLLMQLKRKDIDARPTMEDLRGSGALEEVGDTILFVHKPANAKESIELIVGKAREFESGEVMTLKNEYAQMRLGEWEGGSPPKHQVDDKPKSPRIRKPRADIDA